MSNPHEQAKVHVTHDFSTSADALWAMLGDFSNLSWVPLVHHHEFHGEGPGMERHMYIDETTAIIERLEALDDATRTVTYSIPVNNPLPITDYLATMTVHERGPDSCQLEWSCTWSEPVGMTEEQAVVAVTAFYGTIIPGIEAAIGG